MLKYLMVSFLSLNLFALEISLDSAKENFQTYSTLHLKDSKNFLCEEETDDFNVVKKIICAFPQKPSKNIKNIQNSFFTIASTVKKGTFFLIITPNYKMKLFPMVFDLLKESDVYQPNVKISPHWMIVAYKDQIPYINNRKKEKGLNFPFVMKKDTLPYVGGLDIKGNPVHLKRAEDVSSFVKIKKYYKQKNYTKCLDLINDVVLTYPNSLFKAELLFYQIRVYAKLYNYDTVVDLSKVYLATYASDDNVAEVLSLTAKAYAKINLDMDAEYFFDRLFSEHSESVYSEWGYIYKGEMLELSGGSSKALEFYKKALQKTDDIMVAVTAAYRLASFYSSTMQLKNSAKYTMKIIKAKPEFFKVNLTKSLEIMHKFADNDDYITATALAKALMDSLPDHDKYEVILKDRALWLTKTDDKKETLKVLNRYIKEFPEGVYEDIIKVAKDALFFDISDGNITVILSEYDELMITYKDDTIGNKAIYEKAKLLLENSMYSDVLGFKESILDLDKEIYSDTQDIIRDAAKGSMKEYLKINACQEVLNISNEYNITLSVKWDDKIYNCAINGADYVLSRKTIDRNMKAKTVNERKKWLYRHIKIDFLTAKYKEVIRASKDLILLIEDEEDLAENKEYLNIYRYLFDSHQSYSNNDNMLNTINNIENIFPSDYKDIERYVAVMGIGSRLKDNNIVIKYATEIMKIQEKTASYTQSPYVEFTLYQAYTDKEDHTKALKIIKSVDDRELSKSKRARQKYMLGSIYTKLWRDDEAQVAYQESIDADSSSAWAKLAKSAKGD